MSQTRSSPKVLPRDPNREHLRKEAKRLARDGGLQLAAAQRRLAQEYGYKNWSELVRHVKSLSAAHKATREADEAAGATAPEAVPAIKILLKRPVADVPLSRRAFTGLELKNISNIGE